MQCDESERNQVGLPDRTTYIRARHVVPRHLGCLHGNCGEFQLAVRKSVAVRRGASEGPLPQLGKFLLQAQWSVHYTQPRWSRTAQRLTHRAAQPSAASPLHVEVISLHVAGAAAVAADAERAAVDVPVEVELRGGRGVDAELGDEA